MGSGISIAISAKDNFSQAITTMKNANQAFNKDLTGLSSRLDSLNRTKNTLKVDTDKAKTALKEVEKQFAATGAAADNLKLGLENTNYDNARRNLSLVSENARQAEKDIKSLTGVVSKAENRTGVGTSSILNTLNASGATKMIGDTFSNIASAYVQSAFGSSGGTMFSNVLSSAVSGAAIGSIIPGVGTAIGGVIGAGLGLANGAATLYTQKDDAFKSYYQDQYNTLQEKQSNSLTNGISIAATREQNKISFSTPLGGDFSGNMKKQSQTYAELSSTLEDLYNQTDSAMGQGYIDRREEGMQKQIDYLSGESGTKLQEANYKIGQWKASLENLSEQYNREAQDAVMTGNISTDFSPEIQARLKEMYAKYNEYASSGAEDAGAQMENLLAEAQAIAQDEYNASEGAQLAQKSNRDLAQSIKNDASANDDYWDAGYQMGKQFSMGLASAVSGSELPTASESIRSSVMSKKSYFKEAPGKAFGLSYVPYDNYPALLHQGERVLTASEARARGNSQAVSITGNSFVVREEADIEKIAREITRQISNAILLAN